MGARAPPDAELETPAREVVEGDRLLRQHGRVAEGIGQHERADDQSGRVRGQPGARGHGAIHRLALGPGRSEVIHPRDPEEAGRLGGLRPLDQLARRHAHLGQVQVELHPAFLPWRLHRHRLLLGLPPLHRMRRLG